MSYVSLRHIDKVYDNKVQAVFDFNLEIARKEFIVFVGPSGCGKSTTLRMIAGLEDITAGELWIDGQYSNDRAPKDRDIAMVFQSYALYPHMSVYDNMAFGLKIRRYPQAEIDRRVREAARILEIEDYLERKPKALSGGQRQRVALGRAIVRNAKVFLMDEPLSNLDAKLRVQMRSEIIKLHEELDATTIYVTHDQTEAMTMATRIVVMKAGYIQQIGTPLEIYNNPSNLFVAGFIGSPAMNFIEVTYEKGVITFEDGKKIKLSGDVVKAHDAFYADAINQVNAKLDEFAYRSDSVEENATREAKKAEQLELLQSFKEPHKLMFGLRPEDIYEATPENKEKHPGEVYQIKVTVAELLGHEYHVHADFAGQDLVAKIASNRPIGIHDDLELVFNVDKIHLFDLKTTKRIY
ncbi:MAG: sn-glycerol-3-phosphate ABC transporter ATP-binding protein UgpC [Bacilli bacterium]|nr:sn-glycerol-3-phosphate ABC transporter ATP-binding protein UgpC [Bacilli bacterium]